MTRKPKTKVDELRETLQRKKTAEGKATAQQAEEIAEQASEQAEGAGALEAQIRVAEQEAKEHYDKLLRVMAEFENFKRRMTRERDELVQYGNEKLLSELLPALDDLDRVLDHIPADASQEVRQIADGITLVRKSLASTLEKFGLKEVAAEGVPFDPNHHEAVGVIESEGHDPGTVITVHRKGYELKDRLLRPAMVTVAKE